MLILKDICQQGKKSKIMFSENKSILYIRKQEITSVCLSLSVRPSVCVSMACLTSQHLRQENTHTLHTFDGPSVSVRRYMTCLCSAGIRDAKSFSTPTSHSSPRETQEYKSFTFNRSDIYR